jgi:hypothetical protein
VVTRYDRIAGHPLAGVPLDVLTVARAAVESAARDRITFADTTDDVADRVVEALHEEGYVVWPGRLPDRESLVLACQTAAWQASEHTPVIEAIVDEVVLPLLRRLNGDA